MIENLEVGRGGERVVRGRNVEDCTSLSRVRGRVVAEERGRCFVVVGEGADVAVVVRLGNRVRDNVVAVANEVVNGIGRGEGCQGEECGGLYKS